MVQPKKDDRELTTLQAAEILGLSPTTLLKWRSLGSEPELPWQKRFRKVFYYEQDVLEFKEMKTQRASDDFLI